MGGKQWKPDPPAKIESKCPKCRNHLLRIDIDHAHHKVEARCPCFGTMFLKYVTAFEAIDYSDQLADKLRNLGGQDRPSHGTEEKQSQKGISLQKIAKKAETHPNVLLASVQKIIDVQRFIIENSTATDYQVSAEQDIPVEEAKRIRALLKSEQTSAASPITNKNREPPYTSKEIMFALVQCPYCVSKIRKDRLSQHIQKIHRADSRVASERSV